MESGVVEVIQAPLNIYWYNPHHGVVGRGLWVVGGRGGKTSFSVLLLKPISVILYIATYLYSVTFSPQKPCWLVLV